MVPCGEADGITPSPCIDTSNANACTRLYVSGPPAGEGPGALSYRVKRATVDATGVVPAW
eukprot:scaffold6503_cov360-Prasinococcus_capsulatus_cf.AAC.3